MVAGEAAEPAVPARPLIVPIAPTAVCWVNEPSGRSTCSTAPAAL